jgi:hypothetical protein
MEMLITLIIYVLIIGLLWWLLNYVLGTGIVPEPLATVVRVIAVVIIVLVAIYLLLGFLHGGIHIPEFR